METATLWPVRHTKRPPARCKASGNRLHNRLFIVEKLRWQNNAKYWGRVALGSERINSLTCWRSGFFSLVLCVKESTGFTYFN